MEAITTRGRDAAAAVAARATEALKGATPLPARRALVRARFAARRPTSAWRGLPDFLVIGGMRCGTSSLYKYLSRHPRVLPSLRKETEFFTRYHDEGRSWYRAHFPLRFRQRTGWPAGQAFEATPYYLFHPHAPARAARLLPDARLVVLLRDPVERAFSHHQHMVRHRLEPLPFAAAVDAEGDRLAVETDRVLHDPSYFSRAHHRWSYVARGRYVEQLERWLAHYPASQFHVVRSEDLYADPSGVYRRLLAFLDLPTVEPREFRNHSYAGDRAPRKAAMDDATRAALEAYFAPHEARLRDLLEQTGLYGAGGTPAPRDRSRTG